MVEFFLIVAPLVYVLSYAPVVKACKRTVETAEYPFTAIWVSFSVSPVMVHREAADGSIYPLYSPVDWLIDSTPLRKPLFFWAEIWGVRDAFEFGNRRRVSDPSASRRTEPRVWRIERRGVDTREQ